MDFEDIIKLLGGKYDFLSVIENNRIEQRKQQQLPEQVFWKLLLLQISAVTAYPE
jgi:hypothetical protein